VEWTGIVKPPVFPNDLSGGFSHTVRAVKSTVSIKAINEAKIRTYKA